MSDRDEKGDDMTDRMSRRFGGDSETEQKSEETQTSKTAMSTKTEEASETAQKSENEKVTDMPSVLMYLPEDLKKDLSLRFDELNLKHKREHDEALEKNRDFYPAVVEAALDDEKSLEEILLEDE